MNTLAEILSQQYSDQGIQDLTVFYDSYFFDLKIKNGAENNNVLLIEKFAFDYISGNIERIKNSIIINFGDTENSSPFVSNGNMLCGYLLLPKSKKVLIIGIHKMINGNTIPVLYLYDINSHSYKNIFPKTNDIENFNSFVNYSFLSGSKPVFSINDDHLYLLFQTTSGSNNYINSLVFKIYNDSSELQNYESIQYSSNYNVSFLNVDQNKVVYKIGDGVGVLQRTGTNSYFVSGDVGGLALDDSISFLGLDSTEILNIY